MTYPPTLSLIIPMYNARHTIGPCLDSVLMGITAQVEILVIDDGSTDGSADWVRTCFPTALSNGSLSIVQQTNRGVSAARNAGLQRAQGRYIGFIDADDMVHDNYLGHLLNAIASQPSDIIEFGFHLWDGQHPARAHGKPLYALPRFGHFKREDVEPVTFSSAMWYCWSRLFRRELFAEVRFAEGVHFCEDLMTIAQVYPLARTVSSLPIAPYLFHVNPQGATLNARPDYVLELSRYYRRSLLDQHGDQIDLLKVAVQFAIYSCQQTMGLPYDLDPLIERDLQRVRRNVTLYRYLHRRRWRILWFPALNRRLARLKRRRPAPQGA